MKKIILLSLMCLFTTIQAFSQDCIEDVRYTLQRKEIGKAKRLIDECFAANPQNADVLLMKANVYLQRYSQELESLNKDRKYVIKDPDAIWIANDCFYQSIQINPNVKPKSGNFGSLEGQSLCAPYLYTLGKDALTDEKAEEAQRYFNAAIRSFNAKSSAEGNLYLIAIYSDLALIAQKKGDTVEYKKMLNSAINLKPKRAGSYLLLYDQLLLEGDTVNAVKMLKMARANVPDTLSQAIYNYEINYFAMMNDVEKLTSACDEFIAKFGETIDNLALIASYLNTAGQLDKAEVYIHKGLAINSANFDLLYQMAYSYFAEALKYQSLLDEANNTTNFDLQEKLATEQEVVLQKAHEWSQKAYDVKKDDPHNNNMLQQLKGRLHLPVPEELKTWLQEYKAKQQQGK